MNTIESIHGKKFINSFCPVKPNDRTTLILSKAYMPFGFLTARATVKHLMTERVLGIDSNGNTHDFLSTLECQDWYDQTPCLRTVNMVIPIPTIVISTRSFGFQKRSKDKFLSTKAVYRLYRGVCQYCLEKIPISEATKDHYLPKSAGGTNHDFNLVLACKTCNRIKDSQFPYYNAKGELVKPKKVGDFFSDLDVNMPQKREWEPFLMKS